MTEYYVYRVTLSDNQKSKPARAVNDRSAITLRLSSHDLTGNDELILTKTQIKKIEKSKALGKSVDIKISKSQISDVVMKGGNLFYSLLSFGSKMLPYAMKGVLKILPGLARGALSSLGNFGMDKILGQGQQTGGALIPQDKIAQPIAYKYLLNAKQRQDILNALQSGGQIVIKPTRTESAGFLETFLVLIGVPLLLNALTGKGMQNRPPSSKVKACEIGHSDQFECLTIHPLLLEIGQAILLEEEQKRSGTATRQKFTIQ